MHVGMISKATQIALLDGAVVVVGEAVDDAHLVTRSEQHFADAASNEAGAACDDDGLVLISIKNGWGNVTGQKNSFVVANRRIEGRPRAPEWRHSWQANSRVTDVN